MKKIFHIILTLALAASTAPAHGMASIVPEKRPETPAYNFLGASGKLVDLETLAVYKNKNNLRFLNSIHPDKITAQEELLRYIKSAHDTNSIISLCRALHMCRDLFSQNVSMLEFINQIRHKKFTPTLAHLYVTNIPCGYEYFKDKSLSSLIETVVQEEANCLPDQAYYTYVHAHKWSFDLGQRIYTELRPSNNKEFFPLFFLTYFNPPKDEAALVDLLQKKGNAGYDSQAAGEKYLLSVNTCFFGNAHNSGEATSYYFFYSASADFSHICLLKLLTQLGHAEVYTRYEKEFTALEALHQASSKYGKLWVIKVPKKVHQQVVIPTKAYGYKTEFVIDGKKTDDVNYIQDTLRTRPEAIENLDAMQFRILMTPSTGLNPDLGIKTIPLHCADPVKYAEFEKAFDSLMTKVKADIAAKKAA